MARAFVWEARSLARATARHGRGMARTLRRRRCCSRTLGFARCCSGWPRARPRAKAGGAASGTTGAGREAIELAPAETLAQSRCRPVQVPRRVAVERTRRSATRGRRWQRRVGRVVGDTCIRYAAPCMYASVSCRCTPTTIIVLSIVIVVATVQRTIPGYGTVHHTQ